MQLTPPKKNVFYLSVLFAIVAIVIYVLGMFGLVGGLRTAPQIAFWFAIVGWLVMAAGVAMKGV